MNTLNVFLFHSINNMAGQYLWLDRGIIFLTTYLAYSVSIAVGIYVCVWVPLRKDISVARLFSVLHGIELFFSVGLTALSMKLIKVLVAEPRPFDTLSNVHQLVLETGYAFPSGHASITFAVAAVVYFYHKRLGMFLYLFAVLVALSRVYVGVHYPFDIVAGAILGITIPHVVHWAFSQIAKNKVQ